MVNLDNQQIIFALDIGTRTVTGVLGYKDGEVFKVVDWYTQEHQGRYMYDGQIHHVDKVAQTVERVKGHLEKNSSYKIDRVAIAAAGRALRTVSLRIDQESDPTVEITKERVESLELKAIQQAQANLEKDLKGDVNSYYCVGYSVIHYYLNEGIIGDLVGHRAKVIGVEILATFLPHVVVDSLYTVMGRVNLEVINITLEPIAAINVAFHQGLRLLNLAMVDIGAGTSDIAITRDGSIVAYAMVPMAGDEITEELSRKYLLDFDTAERVKVSLGGNDKVTFTDILGIEYTLDSNIILESLGDKIKELAKEISSKIMEYNQKAPSAVFLVGGGSQIPGLGAAIADILGLPKERVAVRGTEIIKNVDISDKNIKGPEYITSLGIGYTAMIARGDDFLKVKINGETIRLFNSKRITVADALIAISYQTDKMIGRRGKSLAYSLNGLTITQKGGLASPAQIYLNNSPANIHSKLEDGDEIIIEPATNGYDANIKLKDVLEKANYIFIDGVKYYLWVDALVNGASMSEDYSIVEGDNVTYKNLNTLEEVWDYYGIKLDPEDSPTLDGHPIDKCYSLLGGERIVFKSPVKQVKASQADIPSSGIKVIVNKKPVLIEQQEAIFVDIFKYIDFDLSSPKGRLVLLLNGGNANYTDPIKTGDSIQIYWEE